MCWSARLYPSPYTPSLSTPPSHPSRRRAPVVKQRIPHCSPCIDSGQGTPANTRHLTHAGSMLGRRLRRRHNIESSLVQCLKLAVTTGPHTVTPSDRHGVICRHLNLRDFILSHPLLAIEHILTHLLIMVFYSYIDSGRELPGEHEMLAYC